MYKTDKKKQPMQLYENWNIAINKISILGFPGAMHCIMNNAKSVKIQKLKTYICLHDYEKLLSFCIHSNIASNYKMAMFFR